MEYFKTYIAYAFYYDLHLVHLHHNVDVNQVCFNK